MNLAWEVVLRVMDQGQDPHKIQFESELNGSPYREAVFTEINISEIEEQKVKINPLYRFSHIFGTFFDINEVRFPEFREMLFDVFVHYQSQLDLRQGLTKSEYYIREILRDILSGAYGEDAAETIMLFSNTEVKSVLHGMLTLFECGSSMELFRKMVRAVYPKAMVYRNNDAYREILVYLPRDKNDIDERKQDFLVGMFLDINYSVYTFWGYHFGVVDLDETLEFDEIILF